MALTPSDSLSALTRHRVRSEGELGEGGFWEHIVGCGGGVGYGRFGWVLGGYGGLWG